MTPIDDLQDDIGFFELLTRSYARVVGKELVRAGQDASWLYHLASFALLAHNCP